MLQPQDNQATEVFGRIGLDIGEIQIQGDEDARLLPTHRSN